MVERHQGLLSWIMQLPFPRDDGGREFIHKSGFSAASLVEVKFQAPKRALGIQCCAILAANKTVNPQTARHTVLVVLLHL